MPESPASDALERYVNSPEFDKDCATVGKGPMSGGDDLDYSNGGISLWEGDSTPSSDVSFTEPSHYDVSKLEAHLYYFGIRGPRRWGPKLIFRTSKDIFEAPSGPEQEPRLMQLEPVYEHHKLGKDDLWATVRSEVVKLLDQRNILHSSVDLVRFSWVEESGGDEDINTKATPTKPVVTTPITIWVGVLPDTLTGEAAFHSSNDILNLLKEHNISDIDVAYRESVVRDFGDSSLFAPVSTRDPLAAVIDPVTHTLGLPIAGLRTLRRQGTLGFYFRVSQDLYAVTARHVLFPEDEGNYPYSYTAGPKKQVVLMGTEAFTRFLTSIKNYIGTMNETVNLLEKEVETLTARSVGGGANVVHELARARSDLDDAKTSIVELKTFYVKIKKDWTEPKNRVIGHVVWAPPITSVEPPNRFTRDVCVIKLNKEKFSQGFRGNVLDLGPEIPGAEFIRLMYPRIDAPSDFDYPHDRLLKLQGILSHEEISTPNNRDQNGDPIRYVIKRGLTTLTTIGRMTGFNSDVTRYSPLGKRKSVEVVILPYLDQPLPFSRGGDSGSIVVDALGKFVGLLTAGSGPSDASDITYCSPMYWLWETVIKTQFPGADLYFEDGYN